MTSENAYLQVGNEMGVAAMAVFIVMLISLVRRLRAAVDAPGASHDAALLCAGLSAAGAGLIVGGFFLHVWLDLALGLSFWGAAGVALAATERMIEATGPAIAPVAESVAR